MPAAVEPLSHKPIPATGAKPPAAGFHRPLVLVRAGDPVARWAALALAARLCNDDGVVVVHDGTGDVGRLAAAERADLVVVPTLDALSRPVRLPVAVPGSVTESCGDPPGPVAVVADEVADAAVAWSVARRLRRPVELVLFDLDGPGDGRATDLEAGAPVDVDVHRRLVLGTERAEAKGQVAAEAALLVCRWPDAADGRYSVLLLP